MQADIIVRKLGPGDFLQYKELRLFGLKTVPAAFGGTFEEAQGKSDDDWCRALSGDRVHFGAFDGRKLVGMANYERLAGKKLEHRAFVYGVFVHPDFVRAGVGTRVLNRIIEDASMAGVTQLHLGVGADNEPAQGLYSKLGFDTYGHEPSSIRMADRDIDELLMIKFLV